MKELFNDLVSDKNIVVITGAGVSTASGIPDFRSSDGLYNKSNEEFYEKYPELRQKPVEYLLSKSCLFEHPDAFYDFYKANKVLSDNIKPNIVHSVLVDLEKKGYIEGIITQNIDNLHQEAGSENLIAIHGSNDFYCTECGTVYSKERYINDGYKCSCEGCKGIIRPKIVLYGECYNLMDYQKCINMIKNADIIVAAGTSLTVSTVTKFITLFFHNDNLEKRLYILNNQSTCYDRFANVKRYSEDLSVIFSEISEFINAEDLNINPKRKVLYRKSTDFNN